MGACDLGPVRHPEDEVAEPEVIDHELPQIVQQRRRVLEQKRRAHRTRQRLVFLAARLQHHGNVGLPRPNPPGELDARVGRQRAAHRELDVGDDAEDVLLVLDEMAPGVLERAAEKDFRPRLQAHQPVREVDALGHEPQRVVHQLGIDHRQERRIEADVVLDHEDGLHAERAGVVDDVDPILHQLDDGGQDADVALPEEHAGEIARVVRGHEIGDGAAVVGEQRHGRVGARLAEAARERQRVHVADVKRAEHQVVAAAGRPRQRLRAGRDPRQRGGMAEVEIEELAQDELVQLTVLGQRERIVQARDEQDLLHAEFRQIDELLPFADSARVPDCGQSWILSMATMTNAERADIAEIVI